MVVVVGLAVVVRVFALDKVAAGLQVTVGVTVPAQPAIGTAMVCPPVNMAIPPLMEVPVSPPQRMLYPATFELDGPCVSKLKVKGGFVGLVIVTVLFEPAAYGPPEARIVPTEFVMVQVVSSKLLPLKRFTVMFPVKPPVAEAVPLSTVEVCEPHNVTSGPAFTVGKGLT